jgi:hypothetical protein
MAVTLVSEYGRWVFPAGATTLVQFQFCTVNTSGQLITPTASTQPVVILDDAPALTSAGAQGATIVGVNYTVVFTGIMKVIAGTALNPFVPVMSDTNGHAIAAATGGNTCAGFTMAACASSDLVPIFLTFAGYHN